MCRGKRDCEEESKPYQEVRDYRGRREIHGVWKRSLGGTRKRETSREYFPKD